MSAVSATLQKMILQSDDWHVGTTVRNAAWPLLPVVHTEGQAVGADVEGAAVTWPVVATWTVVGGTVVRSFATQENVFALNEPQRRSSQNCALHGRDTNAELGAQSPKQSAADGRRGTAPDVQR